MKFITRGNFIKHTNFSHIYNQYSKRNYLQKLLKNTKWDGLGCEI